MGGAVAVGLMEYVPIDEERVDLVDAVDLVDRVSFGGFSLRLQHKV